MNKVNILLIVIGVLLLMIYYDGKELNDMAILIATEISSDKDYYVVTAGILNTKENKNEDNEYLIYSGYGKTIQEAYRIIRGQVAKYLYPDHLEIMIINKDLAMNDITQVLDFYLREAAVRTEFKVLIGMDNDVLKAGILNDENILDILKVNSKYIGISNLVTFNEMVAMNLSPDKQIVLPTIRLSDNREYELGGLAIFNDSKLVGYLNDRESISYNIINNHIDKSIINYKCNNDKYMALEIIDSKTKIKCNNLSVMIKVNIKENECSINLNDVNRLEHKLSKYFDSMLNQDVKRFNKRYSGNIYSKIIINDRGSIVGNINEKN